MIRIRCGDPAVIFAGFFILCGGEARIARFDKNGYTAVGQCAFEGGVFKSDCGFFITLLFPKAPAFAGLRAGLYGRSGRNFKTGLERFFSRGKLLCFQQGFRFLNQDFGRRSGIRRFLDGFIEKQEGLFRFIFVNQQGGAGRFLADAQGGFASQLFGFG